MHHGAGSALGHALDADQTTPPLGYPTESSSLQ